MSNRYIYFNINDKTVLGDVYSDNIVVSNDPDTLVLQIGIDDLLWQIVIIEVVYGLEYTYTINEELINTTIQIENDLSQMVYDVDIYGKLTIDNEQLIEYLKYTFEEDPLIETFLLNKGILGANYDLLITNPTNSLSKQVSFTDNNISSYNITVKPEGGTNLDYMYLLNSAYIYTLITSLSNSSFSIAFWIELKDITDVKGIFNILYQDKQIIDIYFVDDTLYFTVGNGYGGVKTVYIKTVCTIDEKCHFTFTCLYNSTYNTLTLSIYKNAELEAQTSWNFNPNFLGIPISTPYTYQMFLGKDFVYNRDMTNANFEDFRLYKEILPKGFIYDIYNNSTILKTLYTSNILEVNGYKNVVKIGNNNEITDSTYIEIFNFDKTSQTVIGDDGLGLIQNDTGSTVIGNMTNKNVYLIQNKIPRFLINTSGECEILGDLTVNGTLNGTINSNIFYNNMNNISNELVINNIFTSNYINNFNINTSNQLATNFTNTSNWIKNNDTYTSNFIVPLYNNLQNTSNYIKNNNTYTSNFILPLYNNLQNTSNYIKNNNTYTSNFISPLYINFTNTSNWIKQNDTNSSNYISPLYINFTNTSNWIKNNDTNTSNYISPLYTNFTNTSNWIKNNDINTSNYISKIDGKFKWITSNESLYYMASNIGIGVYPTELLDIANGNLQIYNGDIKKKEVFNLQPSLWYKFDTDPISLLPSYGTLNYDMTIVNNISQLYEGPTDNLFLFYKFDNNVLDNSENALNATNYGATFDTDKMKGTNSIVFNGTTSYVDIPIVNIGDVDIISVACWIKFPSTYRYEMMFHFVPGFRLITWTSGLYFRPTLSNNTNYNRIFETNYPLNTWVHYTFVLSKTTLNKFLKIYKNGILINNSTPTIDIENINSSNNKFANNLEGSKFSGKLDDFRIYKRELNQNDINNIIGISTQNTIIKTIGKPNYPIGNAYNWNGSLIESSDNSYIQYTDSNNISALLSTIANGFTISFLYNTTDIITTHQIFNISTTNGRVIFIEKIADKIYLYVGNGLGDVESTNYKSLQSSTLLANEWYSIICSMEYTNSLLKLTIKIYTDINNTTTYSEYSFNPNYSSLTNLSMNIGKYNALNYDLSPSYIQDFRFYNYKLKNPEIEIVSKGNIDYTYIHKYALESYVDTQIDYNLTNISNMIMNNDTNTVTSNLIKNNEINTSNYISPLYTNLTNTSNYIKNNDINVSNYIAPLYTNFINTSNWIKNNNTYTSNYISPLYTNFTNTSNYIKNNDLNISNYVNRINYDYIDFFYNFELLDDKARHTEYTVFLNDTYMSNHVYNISNQLTTDILNTSNWIITKPISSHSHSINDITNLSSILNSSNNQFLNTSNWINTKPISSHSHSINDITNLSSILNSSNTQFLNTSNWINTKPISSHSHTINDITNLQNILNASNINFFNTSNWINTKPISSHSHTINDITNLQNILNASNINFFNTSNWINNKNTFNNLIVNGTTDNIPDLSINNMQIKSYNKSLGTTVSDYTDICQIYTPFGAFTFQLDVIHNETGDSLSKSYICSVGWLSTSHYRLNPISSSGAYLGNDFAVDILPNGTNTNLRLVRISGTTNSQNYTCILRYYKSNNNILTITNLTSTGTGATNVGIYKSTPLTQVDSKVGIGKTSPNYMLDIGGTINANLFAGDGSELSNLNINKITNLQNILNASNNQFLNTSNWINSKANLTHSHQITDITNLQNILNASNINFINTSNWINTKANLTHTHAITDITNLQNILNSSNIQFVNTSNWINTKANLTHTHAITDITNLQNILNASNINFVNTSNWINSKQNKLTTSTGINIINNVISGFSGDYTDLTNKPYTNWSVTPLTTNIYNNTSKVGIGTDSAKCRLEVTDGTISGTPYADDTYSFRVRGDKAYIALFQHTNQTQGIGINYNTIFATGDNTDQNINLNARGNGNIVINSDLDMTRNKILLDKSYNPNWCIYVTDVNDNLGSWTGGIPILNAMRFRIPQTVGTGYNGFMFENSDEETVFEIRSDRLIQAWDMYINTIVIKNHLIEIGAITYPYPLFVNGTLGDVNIYETANNYMTVGTGSGNDYNTTVIDDLGIYVTGSILATSKFAAISDIRIKKNIVDINDDSALQKIMSIEPKIYNYIDNVKKTNSNVYGFIAQQIREIIPEATSLIKDFVPNVFSVANCNSNIISLTSNIDLYNISSNTIIKCMDENDKEYQYIVEDIISSNSFSINSNISSSNVFVYGTQVDDFHTLDKSYIFTLNVCATQELSRKIDALTNRIEYLENYISSNIN